ncbi:MAG TPA: hypothetical protein V6D03_12320, partial [Candidatus Caenarcaniphilales bacterium]
LIARGAAVIHSPGSIGVHTAFSVTIRLTKTEAILGRGRPRATQSVLMAALGVLKALQVASF